MKMKNKLLSILLTICMVALLLSGSVSIQAYADTFKDTAIKASAATQTVTETWTMNGSACSISGSTLSNGSGNRIVLSNGGGWLNNGSQTILDTNQALILTDQYSMEASFPDIEGTVTQVEFHNICLFCPTSFSMYVGKDMSNLLSISPGVTAFTSWDNAGQFKDVTYTGSLDVSSSAPLKPSRSASTGASI